MKIALVTTHNTNNYGAIFQTYATQLALSKYGDVEIINYNNRHISRSLDLVRFNISIHGVMGTVKDIFRLLPRRRVIKKFNKFIANNLKLTEAYGVNDIIEKFSRKYDVYVAGSDQIWNPSCISSKKAIDSIYFLEFVQDNSKKISYASSIGCYMFSVAEELLVKEYLNKFDSISVREKETQVYLQDLLKRQVQHVLDPTLLLDKNDWLRVSGLNNELTPSERYILLYTVPKAPLIKKVVDELSNKLQMKVIAIDQGLSAGVKVDKQIRDAGPEEFLRLFSCAEFVITDSFHGVCFSLNFERPFVVVSPGVHSNRIESLLNLVSLEDRLIKNDSQVKNIKTEYNYSHAYKMILTERDKSLEFISESLS